MFKKRTSSIQLTHKNTDHCHCTDHNETYQIVENYRSILDRKQSLISTWQVVQKNGKVTFTRGIRFRQGTDVFVIRSNHICLINTWYKYIDLNRKLLSILKQNQPHKVYEIILIECACSTSSNQYELAIIECPCLQQLKTHCAYCRFILAATEETTVSFPLQHLQDNESSVTTENLMNVPASFMSSKECAENDTFSATKSILLLRNDDTSIVSHSELSSQSQDTIKANEDVLVSKSTSETLAKYRSQGTQTKLFAVLLPPSPLSEMNQAQMHATTLMNTTRSCQVNTLSYLIKTRQSSMKIQSIQEFLSNENTIDPNSSIVTKHHPLSDGKRDEQGMNIPNRLYNEQSTFAASTSPLKCVQIYDAVDVDEPSALHTSSSLLDKSFDNSSSDIIQYSTRNYNNNNEQSPFNEISSNICLTSRVCRLTSNQYRRILRRRRRYQYKKRIWVFLRREHRRKKTTSIPHSSSSFIITAKQTRSFNQQTQPPVSLSQNHISTTCHYRAYDHALLVRASKNSTACKQLQILLNQNETSFETLLRTQLELTCNENYRSVCLLLDDHKQSEQYRSSFLHYLYTTLSTTLQRVFDNSSIQLSCMNLVFFHNSLCDMVNMQRLRLIDTGRKILLSPSCEIPLKTIDDIDTALNRLSPDMSFAHQILIINISREGSPTSSSFLFLQLAPICSARPTGLLTNLNSTTYSILNLIRQFNHGQLFNHHFPRRYLLNDCALSRLLKSYLFASQQTMTVLTTKRKRQSEKKCQI